MLKYMARFVTDHLAFSFTESVRMVMLTATLRSGDTEIYRSHGLCAQELHTRSHRLGHCSDTTSRRVDFQQIRPAGLLA